MKSDYLKYFAVFIVLLHITWTISCSGKPGKVANRPDKVISDQPAEELSKLITMIEPAENSTFRLGDPVKIVISVENRNQVPDSVTISFDGKKVALLRSSPWEYSVPASSTVTTGRKPLKAVAYKGGKALTTITRFMIFMSDITPKRSGFKVIHTYPHDRDAFTQGLFFDGGLFYEGTGQETGSSLREVEPATGKVVRQLNLDPSLFGEGITLYKNRIYQVTWQSKVGFVYDKSTFAQINRIYYQSEGWGLTTLDNKIVMSDGTNVLYFFEPEMFTVESRIEVYDNEQKVDSLNELEYINGEIWANIWMSDLIARIDPESGKVLGYINLKGILKDPDTDTSVNVLNGIAYDRGANRIFVTGKNWPKLFEIRVTE